MNDTREFLHESKVDNRTIHTFLKAISKPFKSWPAYSLGIIDDKGNILKNIKFLSSQEKNNFTKFDLLILNLKRIIDQTPMGKTKFTSFAASLYLIRESNSPQNNDNEDMVYEDFTDFYEEIINHKPSYNKLEQLMEDYLPCSNKNVNIDKEEDLEEDAPANSVSSGGVSGLTGDPVVKKTLAVKRKKTFKEYLEK